MASLFFAFSPSRERRLEIIQRRDAIILAMRERSDASVHEFNFDGALAIVAGVDAAIHESSAALGLADGRPLFLDGTGAAEESTDHWTDVLARPDATLARADGSFALCAYDARAHRLIAARDRFGARPLYWVEWELCILVASEIKAFAAAGVPLRIDRDVLAESVLARWVVRENHLFAPIRQLPAASLLEVTARGVSGPRRFWRLRFEPERTADSTLAGFRDRTISAMSDSIVRIASGRRKVGVLLSGGVDSSAIAAVARTAVPECVAFVGRIPGSANTEMERALLVARHLGIECRVVDIEPPTLADVEAMVRRIEEPPRNANNVVLSQLFRAASREVDILLQGDGAEVLFGLADSRRVESYRRKHRAAALLPKGFRSTSARMLRTGDARRAWEVAQLMTTDHIRYAALLDVIRYSGGVRRTLAAGDWPDALELLPMEHFDEHEDLGDALQAYQAHTFLASSLVRHDRLGQPFGLQSISPFLQAPMIEVARRLPRELRYIDNSKPVLRALCDHFLPPVVSGWPKMGFEVPWKQWMPAVLPRAADQSVRMLLPAGYVRAAEQQEDTEALWMTATLGMLIRMFVVKESGSRIGGARE